MVAVCKFVAVVDRYVSIAEPFQGAGKMGSNLVHLQGASMMGAKILGNNIQDLY